MDRTKDYPFVLSTMPRLHARSRLLELGVYCRNYGASADLSQTKNELRRELRKELQTGLTSTSNLLCFVVGDSIALQVAEKIA